MNRLTNFELRVFTTVIAQVSAAGSYKLDLASTEEYSEKAKLEEILALKVIIKINFIINQAIKIGLL